PGIKTDVHVGLYTWARFEDCKEKNGFTIPWLITNTKETEDVIAYALCVGMQVMSWSYPENGSLRDLVEKYHLYPITTLTTLSSSHHQQLLSAGITLCSDIVKNPTAVDILSLPEDKKQQILQEAKSVCMNA
ncbi:MAG TPA: hypothetical protein VFQ63_01455, partial [Patescibacteria group bacterium]|nr:hypothetical protein [Patescibacteria group bacterium]